MKRKLLSLSLLLLMLPVTLSASDSEKNPFRKVAKDVRPVVVQIDTIQRTKVQRRTMDPFEFFFGPNPNNPNSEPEYREYQQKGLGSGVVVEARGKKKYVLTNNHVIQNADELTVHFTNGNSYEAKLVGTDPRRDLALIVFETGDDIPVAKLGDSDDLFIGDWVIAIGSPLGFQSTVTLGIVSATGRTSTDGSQIANFTDYIQTDAAINQGNSGGALVNIDGEIIGINTWIASGSGGSIGLGFAIPINNAKKVIADLLDKGKVEYGWLGVTIGGINPSFVEAMDLEGVEGSFIYGVFKDSPAEKGGIQPGDVIIKVNNKVITNSSELTKAVSYLPADERADFTVIRDGKKRMLKVYPEARKEKTDTENIWPGITPSPLTKEDVKDLPYNEGDIYVQAVTRGSIAEITGIKPGDVILKINNTKVETIKDFYDAVNEGDSDLTFRINRNGRTIQLSLISE